MDLPEIRLFVGLLLPKSALAACARVCKDWHASFIPCLYASLNMCTRPELVPTDLTFALYGHHLKELSFDFIHPQIHAISVACHNIQKLYFHTAYYRSRHRDHLLHLLQSNPRIQNLNIEADLSDAFTVPPNFVRDMLLQCTAVTSVTLIGVKLSKENISALWTISEQLKELRLDGYQFESLESTWEHGEMSWPIFPKLTFLDLCWILEDVTAEAQVRWMGQCPSLQRLIWTFPAPEHRSQLHHGNHPSDFDFSQEWVKLFRSTRCPLLTSVEIYGTTFRDKHLQIMLEQSPALLTHLRVRLFRFPKPATNGWRRHFGTFFSLHLQPSKFKENWVSQIILSSCPRLERFVGTTLFLSDGSSADPWVCDKLRDLTISVWTMDIPQMRQEILDRLIQLKNLGALSIKASPDWFFLYRKSIL